MPRAYLFLLFFVLLFPGKSAGLETKVKHTRSFSDAFAKFLGHRPTLFGIELLRYY